MVPGLWYVRLRRDGATASGHRVPAVAEPPDGRVRVEETRRREPRPGSGTSAGEEPKEPAELGKQGVPHAPD
ncbi:hypothetical protein GCM10009549_21980 [Streptomyces thermoalcalitolerans]|uniref:Uncharacterized protein n=1 Tax=Streptomyces thermoalcalitolerans TaxID=65605 RepID=A0ABP3Z2L1_9ACTN